MAKIRIPKVLPKDKRLYAKLPENWFERVKRRISWFVIDDLANLLDKMRTNKMTKYELWKTCEDFDKNDDSQFRKIITAFVGMNSCNEKKLRRYCCTSKGTISRWANGHSAPYPAMRPAIIKFIMDDLEGGER